MSTRSAKPAAGPRAQALFWLGAAALLAGCARVERAALPAGFSKAGVVDVGLGGQAQAGSLRVGLGYVHRVPPKDVSGAARSLEAGLWIYARGESSKNRAAPLRAGESAQAGDETIFIERVQSGPGASVRLAWRPSPR
ncbi:MAG: hypothetical protein KGL04_06055 [Elusimicrobia bacterium]|nr:hypothetical protein [Elusimicrobiota bacterium]MDE2313717.1 hypothetical protein [Elusimicrobiota bacterium]